VNVSSAAANFAPAIGIDFENINHDKALNPFSRYAQSKLAKMPFTRGLEKRFGDFMIANSVHPGGVATDIIFTGPKQRSNIINWIQPLLAMLFRLLYLSPDQGALAALYVAASPDVEIEDYRACYFVPYGTRSTNVNPLSIKTSLAEKLWDYSEALCKEKLAA
jgi:hypothetical protein